LAQHRKAVSVLAAGTDRRSAARGLHLHYAVESAEFWRLEPPLRYPRMVGRHMLPKNVHLLFSM